MKKRNWLMTIAFAVLSLTIISTCVIGSTYAKFVSKVNGSGKAQAAGFLLTATEKQAGEGQGTAQVQIVAPNDVIDSAIVVNYFSQVDTDITATGETNTANNTGVFTDENWSAIVNYYNENFAALKKIFPGDGGEAAFTDAPAISDIFTVEGTGELAKTFVDAIVAEVPTLKIEGNATRIKAMAPEATASIEVEVNASVKWTTHAVGGDVFDSLLGAAITTLLQNKTSIELVAGKALTLTGTGASTIGVTIGLVATQVVAGA